MQCVCDLSICGGNRRLIHPELRGRLVGEADEAAAGADGAAKVAFGHDPDHPVVVIDHDERGELVDVHLVHRIPKGALGGEGGDVGVQDLAQRHMG